MDVRLADGKPDGVALLRTARAVDQQADAAIGRLDEYVRLVAEVLDDADRPGERAALVDVDVLGSHGGTDGASRGDAAGIGDRSATFRHDAPRRRGIVDDGTEHVDRRRA